MAKKLEPAPGPRSAAHADSAAARANLPGPVSRENAEHYRWGTNCDAWFMMKDKHLTVIEEFMPPGAAEIRHYHEKAQQFFYILAGEVMMEVEGQTMLIHAGGGIHVLPGSRHQIRNPSSSPARFLVISQPPSRGDRVAK
jgi:mannose-6-phosphate isomerase-like protein (cupin superfamily)